MRDFFLSSYTVSDHLIVQIVLCHVCGCQCHKTLCQSFKAEGLAIVDCTQPSHGKHDSRNKVMKRNG